MLKRLSRRLALHFTYLVFFLLIVVGIVFMSADFFRLRQATNQQLSAQSNRVLARINHPLPSLDALGFSKRDLTFTRLLSTSGTPLYAGEFFLEVPTRQLSNLGPVYAGVMFQNKQYRILTTPLFQNATSYGYLQVATEDLANSGELIKKASVYGAVCIALSFLTFLLGLEFAKRNLEPVRESMERLARFTQDASHELRTPLAVLGSTIDLALKTKSYKEGLLSAKKDVVQAAVLVERLLELAQLDKLRIKKKELDLSVIAADVVNKLLSSAQETNVLLTCNRGPGTFVQGDEALTHQLISNLVQNAIKFTPAGGRVDVLVEKNSLCVKDTGIGISPNEQAGVFDRFYQVDGSRSKDGLGLGLAIVQKIVEMHNWHLKMTSALGEGTTIKIIFPPSRS
jgi:signal transduction histidine kinase